MCQTCNNPAHDDLNDDVFDIFGLSAPAAVAAPVATDTGA